MSVIFFHISSSFSSRSFEGHHCCFFSFYLFLCEWVGCGVCISIDEILFFQCTQDMTLFITWNSIVLFLLRKFKVFFFFSQGQSEKWMGTSTTPYTERESITHMPISFFSFFLFFSRNVHRLTIKVQTFIFEEKIRSIW
jgi:hypothetical protein